MSRKKKHEEHENHERWLVSYADFITLLFAFFTVLYATSQSDQRKVREVQESMDAAFAGGMSTAILNVLGIDGSHMGLAPTQLPMDAASDTAIATPRTIGNALSNHPDRPVVGGQVLTVKLPRRFLFAPGSAELHPVAFEFLSKVAAAMKGTDVQVEVVGSADSAQLGAGSMYQDNWDLAAARGAATARYLQERGVPGDQLKISALISEEEDAESRAVALQVHVSDPDSAALLANRLNSLMEDF